MNPRRISLFACLFLFPGFLQADPEATDTLNIPPRLGKVDPRVNILSAPEAIIWGGSAIRGEDGKYHLFYATWGDKMQGRSANDRGYFGMRGWLKYSTIAHAVSDSPAGPYQPTGVIVTGSGDPGRWDTFSAHNPHIKKFNGKYYLYYIATHNSGVGGDWMAHAGGQRIGLIVTDSIEDLVQGRFKKPDQPLLSPDDKHTFHRVVNPSVSRGHDGKYYMMLKTAKNKAGAGYAFWMARADRPEGPFAIIGDVFTSDDYRAEDPYFWYDSKRGRYYAVVKNWTQSGKLGPQYKCLSLITSSLPHQGWRPATHKLFSLREYTTNEGKKVTLDTLERPQLLFDEKGRIIALFAAAAEKNPFQLHDAFNLHIPILPEAGGVE